MLLLLGVLTVYLEARAVLSHRGGGGGGASQLAVGGGGGGETVRLRSIQIQIQMC